MKTILVTGGAGLIGSNLCAYLLNKKNRVICVDNLLTSSRENIADLLDAENFKFIKHDVINLLSVKEDIDEIYNLACPASPVHYQKDPIQTVKINTIGVINILNLACAKKAKVLQASTSEVYGDPLEHPQKETYRGNVNPDGPRACYDEGKRCAETLFFDYYRKYALRIKVVRIFNTYGPRMATDDGRVVSNFILQALRDENITVFGNGSQTRSFCYVDDLVLGLVGMMESNDSIVGPINLGNPDEFTVNELACEILRLTGSKGRIIYKNLPIDDPARRCPDITLAKDRLGWEPKIKLQEGLIKTVDYFRKLV